MILQLIFNINEYIIGKKNNSTNDHCYFNGLYRNSWDSALHFPDFWKANNESACSEQVFAQRKYTSALRFCTFLCIWCWYYTKLNHIILNFQWLDIKSITFFPRACGGALDNCCPPRIRPDSSICSWASGPFWLGVHTQSL